MVPGLYHALAYPVFPRLLLRAFQSGAQAATRKMTAEGSNFRVEVGTCSGAARVWMAALHSLLHNILAQETLTRNMHKLRTNFCSMAFPSDQSSVAPRGHLKRITSGTSSELDLQSWPWYR